MRQSEKKSILLNVALSFASLFLFVLMLEIALSLFGYGDLVIYKPDPKLFWRPLPNQNCYTKIDHKPVNINNKGTRGKDFYENKPENVFRIISLGDSKTFGWGLNDFESYSGLLEKLLQNHMGDSIIIEVINAGVNAWSYAQIYVYLRDIGIEYNPDMVILADANLYTQFTENSNKEFIDKMKRRVWIKNLLRRSAIYHYIIEKYLLNYYLKYRENFIPTDPKKDTLFIEQQKSNSGSIFKEQITQICELLKDRNVKGLLINIPWEGETLSARPMVRGIKDEVSKKFNIPFIDFTKEFSRNPQKLFFPGDYVHPNVEGNKVIGNRIFKFLIKEIK